MVVPMNDRMIGSPRSERQTGELIARLRDAKLAGDRRTERRLRDELRARGLVFGDELPEPIGATTGATSDICTR